MPPLPVISGRQALEAMQKAGWNFVRQKGSHMILVKENNVRPLVIPDHKTLDRGTLRCIIRSAELSVDEFIALIKED